MWNMLQVLLIFSQIHQINSRYATGNHARCREPFKDATVLDLSTHHSDAKERGLQIQRVSGR